MPTRRFLLMLSMLRTWRTIRELRDASGGTDRMARRDLAYMRRLGFTVEQRTDRDFRRKRWRLRAPLATLRRMLDANPRSAKQ
jgi:predicted DNA-binding transcriptional regulator YafY